MLAEQLDADERVSSELDSLGEDETSGARPLARAVLIPLQHRRPQHE